MKTPPVPATRDKIYVEGAIHMSRGADDFAGGIATVSKVEDGISGGKPCKMISIKERPGVAYNWDFLGPDQAKLKERYGNALAHPDPDYRSEFNGPGAW